MAKALLGNRGHRFAWTRKVRAGTVRGKRLGRGPAVIKGVAAGTAGAKGLGKGTAVIEGGGHGYCWDQW